MTGPVRQRGLTLVELLFALTSLAALGLAIGTLMVGAGNAWATRDHYLDQTQAMRTVETRITEWVRQSRRVVSVAGDARYIDIVLWADDDADPGVVNLGEIKVITYDCTLKTLTLYAADPSSGLVQAPASVGSDSYAPSFRSRSDVTAYPLAENVAGFAATATNGVRSGLSYQFLYMEMSMLVPEGAADQRFMTAAAVRAPETTVDFLDEAGGGRPLALSLRLGVNVGSIDVDAAVNVSAADNKASVLAGLKLLSEAN